MTSLPKLRVNEPEYGTSLPALLKCEVLVVENRIVQKQEYLDTGDNFLPLTDLISCTNIPQSVNIKK
jgi:hypothetical protein